CSMPVTPEDRALAKLLLARGLPEAVLRECAAEGDGLEAQGRPRPRLGAQLVARRVIPPDVYVLFCTTGELPPPRPTTGRLTRADTLTPSPPPASLVPSANAPTVGGPPP